MLEEVLVMLQIADVWDQMKLFSTLSFLSSKYHPQFPQYYLCAYQHEILDLILKIPTVAHTSHQSVPQKSTPVEQFSNPRVPHMILQGMQADLHILQEEDSVMFMLFPITKKRL